MEDFYDHDSDSSPFSTHRWIISIASNRYTVTEEKNRHIAKKGRKCMWVEVNKNQVNNNNVFTAGNKGEKWRQDI